MFAALCISFESSIRLRRRSYRSLIVTEVSKYKRSILQAEGDNSFNSGPLICIFHIYFLVCLLVEIGQTWTLYSGSTILETLLVVKIARYRSLFQSSTQSRIIQATNIQLTSCNQNDGQQRCTDETSCDWNNCHHRCKGMFMRVIIQVNTVVSLTSFVLSVAEVRWIFQFHLCSRHYSGKILPLGNK